MSPKTKKLILFGCVFAVWLVLDLVSKDWADRSLATRSHPLPVQITEADAGKPLAQVLADRLGWVEGEGGRSVSSFVRKLGAATPLTAADRVFSKDSPLDRAVGLYVFWRGGLDVPPRYIPRRDHVDTRAWLKAALPNADRATIDRLTDEALGAVTLGEWLPEEFRKLDAEDVDALGADRIFAVTGLESIPTADQAVAAGEMYIVTHEQIPVMGEWFSLVYAENPGAAFGFLKGVSPGVRQTIFALLTILAFIVILYIAWRMPADVRLVYIAFGGILAGAAGNFVDRIRFGYVIDFIDMDLGFMKWPTYNVADIAISLGVIALVLDITFNKNSALLSKKDRERRSEKQAEKKAKRAARSKA